MKYITLTKNQKAIVDDTDFEEIGKHKWYAWWNPHTKSYYARRNQTVSPKRQITLSLQREIMLPNKGFVVDHINHDTLDNRRENLRVCSLSQNAKNSKRKGKSSGLKGVTWYKRGEKWAAIKHYGEFAYFE